jgi:putative transcriptional regulator
MKELKEIGKNISTIRRKKGLTQLDLASACGMETNSLGRIENGRTNPTVKTLLKLAKALDVKLTELVKLK